MIKLPICGNSCLTLYSSWVPRCYKRQRSQTGVETAVPLDLDVNQLVARAADLGDN